MAFLMIRTAKLVVIGLLFLYHTLTGVLFISIHHTLNLNHVTTGLPSPNDSTRISSVSDNVVHGWNTSALSNKAAFAGILFEEDVMRLLFTLPTLLTIILYLPFNDGSSQKVTYRLPILGLFIASLLSLLSSVRSFHSQALLYAALLIYSLCGGVYFMTIGSLWCIYNNTEKCDLTEAFGFMLSAVFFGSAVSNGVRHQVESDPRSAIITCTVMSIVMLILSLLWTIESKGFSTSQTQVLNGSSEEQCCDVKRCSPLAVVQPLDRRAVYIVLSLISIALYRGCEHAEETTVKIYTSDPHGLNWSSDIYYLYLMLVFLCQGFVLYLYLPASVTIGCACTGLGTAILPRVLVRYAHMTHTTTVMIALGLKVLSLGFTSFAVESWMMYLNLPIEMFAPLIIPCLLTVIHNVSAAAAESCGSQVLQPLYHGMICSWIVADAVTPLISTALGEAVYKLFNGSVLVITAAVMVVLFIAALWLSVDMQTHNHQALLESLKPEAEEHADDASTQIDTEQWLLEAYDQEVEDICEDTIASAGVGTPRQSV